MKGKELKKTTTGKYMETVLSMKVGWLLAKLMLAFSKVESASFKCDGACGDVIHGLNTVVYTNGFFSVCEECYDPEAEYDVTKATGKLTLKDVRTQEEVKL